MLKPKEVLGLSVSIALLKRLIKSRDKLGSDLWLIPILNPDGYSFMEKLPTDKPLRLKNMANTCASHPEKGGVNLAHNWGYQWDTVLPKNEETLRQYQDPCDVSYHGSKPFSEPETAAARDFINKVNPSAAIFLHQRAQSLESRIIYPYTFHPTPLYHILKDDMAVIKRMVDEMNTQGIYRVGSAIDITDHTISGSEIDYLFENGIWSLILQIGADRYLPTKEEIKELSEKHVDSLLAVSRIVPNLPQKKGLPRKGWGWFLTFLIYLVPVVLGVALVLVLLGVFGVAKYLGYDDIWNRFKLFVHRLRRWKVYSQYRGIKEEDDDLEIEENPFQLEEDEHDA